MTLNAGSRLDRYEIRRQLAQGGMGEVYLVHDSQLDRTVALKVLPPALAADTERVRRFVNEAKAASGLNHPNILTVFDNGRFADVGQLRQPVDQRFRDALGEVLGIRISVHVQSPG